MIRYTVKIIITASILLLLGGLAAFWYVSKTLDTPLETGLAKYSIQPGDSITRISRDLYEKQVLADPWSLALLGRYQGTATRIKAGDYRIDKSLTMRQLLDKFVRGEVVTYKVSLPEGWTFRQFREAIAAQKDLQHITIGWNNKKILARVGATETSPEGLFFPDTYVYRATDSDLDVLKQAYKAMQAHLAKAWKQRQSNTPLENKYQALILASIIEKETARPAERPLIGGVFVNRLNKGMLLQTDPTVIYGLGPSFDGNLTRKNLEDVNNPYNTYVHPGLPPTPIAMPGAESLRAAVAPEATGNLYFVARGDGSHEFSSTYEQHRRAVAKYQLGHDNG